jgi:hypothetical protein
MKMHSETSNKELTDCDIIALVNQVSSEDDGGNDARTVLGLAETERMSHSEELRAFRLTLNSKGKNYY